MDILVIRDRETMLEVHERVTRKLLTSLIECERLQVILLDSPLEDRQIAVFFDEEGVLRHRPENFILPGGDRAVRGPVVIAALDEHDRETGLLAGEHEAYQLFVRDDNPFPELRPTF
jgi:hypothetical protein